MTTLINRNDHGFTLFEVVLVLVLISIFATIAVLRQPETDVSLRAQTDVLRSHIRYTQMRAMNTNEVWGIGYDGSAYYLFRQTPSNRRVLPGEATDLVNLNTRGISISTLGGGFPLSFDTWGRPYSSGGLLTAPLLMNIVKNGQTQTLAITPHTGFVM